MIIDTPRKKDLPALKQIWQEAFGDSPEFLNGFFQKGFSPERCRCLLWEDRPVAVLYWFDCFFHGKKLAYIYAVATDKAFRGRGLCRQLMDDTHRHLKNTGYSAATLVPENEALFAMYGTMGYRRFCPMTETAVQAGVFQLPVEKITAEEFFHLRNALLPPKGILQDSVASYLDTFTEFYRAAGAIMCLRQEKDTLYFQEFFGDKDILPGIITALQAQNALVNLPGGDPYAMYLPFDGTDLEDAYLGIALG